MQPNVLDWLNENELRGYPLRENTNRLIGNTGVLLDKIILDAQIIYAANPIPATVNLTQIVVAGDSVTFTVLNQPNFVVSKSASFPVYIRNSEGSLLVIGKTVASIPDGTYNLTVPFEDGVCSEFRDAWKGVQSISFDGASKTGDITFEEGYQVDIKIKGSEIHLSADANYGKPIGCEEFFGATVNDCDEIISSINNITPFNNPSDYRFVAGRNVSIFEDPENHRIYIGLNFSEDSVCKSPLANPTGNVI
jgi:hypothetical protein